MAAPGDSARSRVVHDPRRRRKNLCDDAARRYDRGLSNRIKGATIDAPAHEADVLLRRGDASRDHSAGADSGGDGPSISSTPCRTGKSYVSASEAQAGLGTDA